MGRYRTREFDVVLPHGQEVRLADAPVSEPIKNFTITIAPSTGGVKLPAGAGNLEGKVLYGGGWDEPPKAYAVPHYDTGVQQGAAIALAAASALPQLLFEDVSHLPGDRYKDGMNVRQNPGLARALWLRNNIGVTTTVVCKVIMTTETVSEAI